MDRVATDSRQRRSPDAPATPLVVGFDHNVSHSLQTMCVALLVCGFLGSSCAHGGPKPSQSSLGTLVVKVVDERGDTVVDALVSLEGVTEETLKQQAGGYWFAQLLPGAYVPVVTTKLQRVQFKEGVRIREGRLAEIELIVPDSAVRPPPPPPPPPPIETRTGTIKGRVVSEAGKDLQYASVIVVNARTGGQTDSNGHFLIRNVPIGVYRVRVRIVGFRQEDRDGVRVNEGDTTTVDFRLHSQAVKMRY